jgi:Lipocalin-like domain
MKKIIIFAILVSLFISCKKSNNGNSGNTCNQDMNGISGTYKITGVTYKPTSTAAEQDYYSQFFPNVCERDDLYILNANGTYAYTDAGVKCSPPGDYTGNWNINGNLGNIDGYSITIQSFNCTSLVIVWPDFFVFGDQVKFTFTRQ